MNEKGAQETITVSLVEDSDRVRNTLAALLESSDGFHCIGAHPSAEAALKAIPQERPDVVLMDITLRRMSGIDCVRRLKQEVPHQLVVMLTAYGDDDLIFQALKAGANGYLLKQAPSDEILAAIREVHAGGAPMSSNIARKVIQSFHQPTDAGSQRQNLSPRELQVLKLLAKGYSNKEIADELNLSDQTVHVHVRHIYTKLHVRSRAGAVARFYGD